MNIKEKAKEFAILAHKGQVRKSDKEKPMIIHPINVGLILEEYEFDDNVVAAGYLHDVIEDTKYSEEDILKLFNEDITSLVVSASEMDKTLSWEERKQRTIDSIKNLDLRHKAIICADKISNLEDLIILKEINGKLDFSNFNRNFDSQKWYYENIYKSLINNVNETVPMYERLKYLYEYLFYDKKDDEYLKNVIFKDNISEYDKLLKIKYKVKELVKLNSVIQNKKPFVIEFMGTPRTGKTTIINNLYDLFIKASIKVSMLEEFTTSKKYKKEIKPNLKNQYKKIVNFEIPRYVKEELECEIKKENDIILIDRSLFDRLIWVDRLHLKGELTKEEYEEYKKEYVPMIKNKIDIIIGTYTDATTAIKRDYKAYLSLEKRSFLNEENVNEYNTSLINIEKLSKKENINFYLFDTTNKSQRKCTIDITNKILDCIKTKYIDELKKEYS